MSVNFYAESEGIQNIQIVADKVSDPAAHEGMLERYKLLGATEGYMNSDFAHIDFPFRWEDSRQHFGLQAIDTALFILNRAARLNRNDVSSKGDREVLKTAQILLPNLHRSSRISYLQNRESYYLMPELNKNSFGGPKEPRADNDHKHACLSSSFATVYTSML